MAIQDNYYDKFSQIFFVFNIDDFRAFNYRVLTNFFLFPLRLTADDIFKDSSILSILQQHHKRLEPWSAAVDDRTHCAPRRHSEPSLVSRPQVARELPRPLCSGYMKISRGRREVWTRHATPHRPCPCPAWHCTVCGHPP